MNNVEKSRPLKSFKAPLHKKLLYTYVQRSGLFFKVLDQKQESKQAIIKTDWSKRFCF